MAVVNLLQPHSRFAQRGRLNYLIALYKRRGPVGIPVDTLFYKCSSVQSLSTWAEQMTREEKKCARATVSPNFFYNQHLAL